MLSATNPAVVPRMNQNEVKMIEQEEDGRKEYLS